MSRAYDALYDTVYTVSSATDHYREQARLGGFQVERCPVYENFTSVLSHYPSTTFRLKGRDHVPLFISREYRSPVRDPEHIHHISSKDQVCGMHRFKFSQRSLLTSNIPIILVKSAIQPKMRTGAAPDAVKSEKKPTSYTVGTQSDYREGEAQTDPYSPEYTLPSQPSFKQQLRSMRYVSPGVPEITHLSGLKFKLGERPGVHHVAYVNKLRAKRTFEATLPPLNEVSLLPVRQKMMEHWENKEWQEREDEVESAQENRLALLQEAIIAREKEVEARHKARVQKATDKLLSAKQLAFNSIQRDRIKAIRHFTEARKYVDKNRYRTKMSESIIDKYAFPGSSVYAPPQREGRFPDSRPKGKGIETEHFVPSSMSGLQTLEEYLPKRLLEAKIQGIVKPKKLDYKKRKEQALRKHLDHVSEALSSARAAGQAAGAPAGGLGYGDAWPVPVAGQAQDAEKKASMKKKKAVVRNAERPQTPIHEPPPDDDEAHRAAIFLQCLMRGRAIQNDMMDAASTRDALLTELLHPLCTDMSVGVTFTPQEAYVANMVASSIRPVLIALAADDAEERQRLLEELAQQQQAIVDMPDAEEQHEPMPSDDLLNDPGCEKAALKIQCGFRGFRARKRVAAMKSEGEQMRKQLLAGATIIEVGTVDLSQYENDLDKITTIQATMRGHLERKKLQHRQESVVPGKGAESGLPGNSAAPSLPDLTMVTEEQAKKVVIVQAGIRGYLARKHMREQRLVKDS